MSDVTIHPVRFVLSDVDGTLLHPDHSLSQRTADAIRAIQITARTPQVHGAPIHIGDPALIGIADLRQPDYGEAVDIHADELPVFWACGVTPQAALERACPDFCITHAPGAMLITDLLNHQLASF